jgi:hypothetical protein
MWTAINTIHTLTYSLELFLEVSQVVAVGDAEELVGEPVLRHGDARWVRRADGQHRRWALSMLHAPKDVTCDAVSSGHGAANGRVSLFLNSREREEEY